MTPRPSIRKAPFGAALAFIAVFVAVAFAEAASAAAVCEGGVPTDRNRETPGTDACPARLPELECAETFYLRQDGRGSDPHSPEGALGPEQFNDAGRWDSEGGKEGKIGPGDCIHVVGEVTGPLIVRASGKPGRPITITGERMDGDAIGAVVGSVAFSSRDFHWTKDRNGHWWTDGSSNADECGNEARRQSARDCPKSGPGLAAALGLQDCEVLWVRDEVARARAGKDFTWRAGTGGRGDRLTLTNPDLVRDPNGEDVAMRCTSHRGRRINENTCGAPRGLKEYFCEGFDYPSSNYAIDAGDHSYIEIRSLRIAYANIGLGLYGSRDGNPEGIGHNTVRCSTFTEIARAAVFVGRQYGGNNAVYDSAFYGVGDGIYVYHPDGGSGHRFCGNVFVGVNDDARNNADGHAIGLQEALDVRIEWNYIERARKPIALWAWREDPAKHVTTGVQILHNHIVDAVSLFDQGGTSDGAGIILLSGTSVHGNTIANNVIEDDPTDEEDTLATGIWAAGSGSESTPPNRFVNNTIVGADVSIFVGPRNTRDVFERNISYAPGELHVRVARSAQRKGGGLTFEENLYYPPDKLFVPDGGKPVDFERWRGTIGGESRSMVADPMFEDNAKREYRLRQGSPARERGIGAALDQSVGGDGRERGSGPE